MARKNWAISICTLSLTIPTCQPKRPHLGGTIKVQLPVKTSRWPPLMQIWWAHWHHRQRASMPHSGNKFVPTETFAMRVTRGGSSTTRSPCSTTLMSLWDAESPLERPQNRLFALARSSKRARTHSTNTDISWTSQSRSSESNQSSAWSKKLPSSQIGRAHVWTHVTSLTRMPSSAWKKTKT